MTTPAALREMIVETARSWCGTPFHDVAGLKGVGVDCAHLLERVYVEAGAMTPLPITPYPPDWHLHRSEELFLGYVLKRGREIPRKAVEPGDMAIFKVGRCYSHGAIVVDWPRLVHAWKDAGQVLESDATEFDLAARPTKFFTLF